MTGYNFCAKCGTSLLRYLSSTTTGEYAECPTCEVAKERDKLAAALKAMAEAGCEGPDDERLCAEDPKLAARNWCWPCVAERTYKRTLGEEGT